MTIAVIPGVLKIVMPPRPLTQRENKIIHIFVNCPLEMTPKEFYAKWEVNYQTIAAICHRELSTVRRWFSEGKQHREPTPEDLRYLALADFLLENYEKIPQQLIEILCPDQL